MGVHIIFQHKKNPLGCPYIGTYKQYIQSKAYVYPIIWLGPSIDSQTI